MYGPLLSMTHSARCDIAASVISAREGWPVLRQALEHLRRPDHRHVRGLADPQDLLLHLGQALEAAFDGEVAARDHDAAPRRLHRLEQHRGQVLEARAWSRS